MCWPTYLWSLVSERTNFHKKLFRSQLRKRARHIWLGTKTLLIKKKVFQRKCRRWYRWWNKIKILIFCRKTKVRLTWAQEEQESHHMKKPLLKLLTASSCVMQQKRSIRFKVSTTRVLPKLQKTHNLLFFHGFYIIPNSSLTRSLTKTRTFLLRQARSGVSLKNVGFVTRQGTQSSCLTVL